MTRSLPVVAAILLVSFANAARAADAQPAEPPAASGQAQPEKVAPGASPAKDAPAAKPPAPRAPPPSDLDFDLLGKPKQQANPALQKSLETRRKMLTLHPAFGLATWAALTATVVVGQIDFNDRFRGGGDTGKYHGWHTGLAYGTSALFLTTGLLGVLAPKPFPTPARFDTALLHKIAMGAATAGMVAQIVLGIVARGQAGSLSERRVASAHQLVGYGTLGAYTVGTVVLVF